MFYMGLEEKIAYKRRIFSPYISQLGYEIIYFMHGKSLRYSTTKMCYITKLDVRKVTRNYVACFCSYDA